MDHKEQMKLFYEIFDASLPRLGPGDDALTQKALSGLFSENQKPKTDMGPRRLQVLDIGCGNGSQTLELARRMDCEILAVDNHQPYLTELDRRAAAAGLSDKINTCLMDMSGLGREQGPFDLIWSEGALYLMGFAEGVLNPHAFRDGLQLCHDLLVPDGLLAVSELCWFRPDPPQECREFFEAEFPYMPTAEDNLGIIESCGLRLLDHFALPESAWLDNFYRPLEERLRSMRELYAADREKLDLIEGIQMEIDIYRKHSSYYGYLFFLMQRGEGQGA